MKKNSAGKLRFRSPQVALSALVVASLAAALIWFLAGPDDLSGAQQFEGVARVLRQLVAISFLSGLAGMAAVQFLKNLFPCRGAHHVRYLESYFGDSWSDLNALARSAGPQPLRGSRPNMAKESFTSDGYERFKRDELLERRDFADQKSYQVYLRACLQNVGEDRSKSGTAEKEQGPYAKLWDEPTEQVVAQIGQIAEFVMARPENRVRLLQGLAGAGGSASVDSYVLSLSTRGEEPAEVATEDLAYEVRHHVEQRLDSLLARMGGGWRRKVRAWAAVTAAFVGLGALLFAEAGPSAKLTAIASSGVLGGFFAWFLRDVAAAIERWRS